jgi:hypothetical protein
MNTIKGIIIAVVGLLTFTIVVPVALGYAAFSHARTTAMQEFELMGLEVERVPILAELEPPAQPPPASPTPFADSPILLTVFVFDSCGGCGVGLTGCGACDVKDSLHIRLLNQFGGFGGRLHDGSIEYRLLNTRLLENGDLHQERNDRFGVPEGLRNMLPAAFIGTAYEGIYLIGDDIVPFVQPMLDRYLAGEDRLELQREIMGLMRISGAPCCH